MNNPARILVADDNETNRDILATRLEANGYEVLHAADAYLHSGQSASQHARLVRAVERAHEQAGAAPLALTA